MLVVSPLERSIWATEREQLLRTRTDGYAARMSELPDKLGAIRAAVSIFLAERLPYALIGGLAVGIRSGVPRATLDVDFAVTTAAARPELIATFTSAGFRLRGEFAHSINFVHSTGEPVQLAFDPVFDPMIARASPFTDGDLELRVVTTEDLIEMKRRAAADPSRRRSKALRDQADIALLEGDIPSPDEGW